MENDSQITEAAEADLIEQHEPIDPADHDLRDPTDGYPHLSDDTALAPGDPLLDVAVRLYADYADHTTLADTIHLVARCRGQLDVLPSPAALPELVERLARQRLTDRLAASSSFSAGVPDGART